MAYQAKLPMPIYLPVPAEQGKLVRRKFLPKPSIVRIVWMGNLATSVRCVVQLQTDDKKT